MQQGADAEVMMDFVVQKAATIQDAITDGIVQKRRQAGLTPMVASSELSAVAKTFSDAILVEIDYPDADEMTAEYKRLATTTGYRGQVDMRYLRKTYSLATPDELIAYEFIDHVSEAVMTDFLEDWAIASSVGYDERRPAAFGICFVLGGGWTDGNALVIQFINEERRRRGIRPLNVDPVLRQMARTYLALDTIPDMDQIHFDLFQLGYAHPSEKVSVNHSGVYAPLHNDRDISGPEVARLVADEYLRDGELLLKPAWKDIGVAVGTQPVLPVRVNPAVPSFLSEYVIARHVPTTMTALGGFYMVSAPRRPAPPVEKAGRRRRWWWPF